MGNRRFFLTWMLSVSFARCLMISPCCAGCICSSFLMTTTDSATTSSAGREGGTGAQGSQVTTRRPTDARAMPPDPWLSSTTPCTPPVALGDVGTLNTLMEGQRDEYALCLDRQVRTLWSSRSDTRTSTDRRGWTAAAPGR